MILLISINGAYAAAVAYGSKAGNPKYNFAADIDEDGDVDIFDLSAMAVNYGKTCP